LASENFWSSAWSADDFFGASAGGGFGAGFFAAAGFACATAGFACATAGFACAVLASPGAAFSGVGLATGFA
jgi:hypothetical protein